jgi:hypothetical protein
MMVPKPATAAGAITISASCQQRLQPRPLRIRQVMPLEPVIIHCPIQAGRARTIYDTL